MSGCIGRRGPRRKLKYMCPHCGEIFSRTQRTLIPTHGKLGERVCPGSGQIPRNPDSDKRLLWKDLP